MYFNLLLLLIHKYYWVLIICLFFAGSVNIHFGKQKFEVSQELTLQKCMQLCTLLDLRPADCDRVQRSESPGIELLQILEEKGLYGEENCQHLRTALERIGMKKVALILQPSEKMLGAQELSGRARRTISLDTIIYMLKR